MSERLQWFLIGVLVVIGFLVAWDIGAIPRQIPICSYDEQTHAKECSDYHILLGALWYLGEGVNYFGAAITALATIFIALFTKRLFSATSDLKESTDKLWRASESAELRQIADTRILQRAYLEAKRGGIDVVPDNQVTGEVVFFNAGALPARKVTVYAKIMWRMSRDVDAFQETAVPQRDHILPAKSELPTGTGSLEDGASRLFGGVGYIYVWGRATYEDGFGEQRWLTFCHRYNCKSARGNGIRATDGRMHHHYNDGD